jgi:hypothetical protein
MRPFTCLVASRGVLLFSSVFFCFLLLISKMIVVRKGRWLMLARSYQLRRSAGNGPFTCVPADRIQSVAYLQTVLAESAITPLA